MSTTWRPILSGGRSSKDKWQEEAQNSPLTHSLSRRNTAKPCILISTIVLLLIVIATLISSIITQGYGSDGNIRLEHFERNAQYESMLHSHDNLWQDLLGENVGVHILPSGIIAATGMFHQLHCLATFRQVIQQLQEGKKIIPGSNEDLSHHWPHCFDYMRQVSRIATLLEDKNANPVIVLAQVILCYADDTVELSSYGIISGYVDRQCRDSKKLYEADSNMDRLFILSSGPRLSGSEE